MFVAIWMVCVVGYPCVPVVEAEPVLFDRLEPCVAHAEHGAREIITMLYEERKRAEVRFECRPSQPA